MIRMNVWMDDECHRLIKAHRKLTGVNKSELFRRAIKNYLPFEVTSAARKNLRELVTDSVNTAYIRAKELSAERESK